MKSLLIASIAAVSTVALSASTASAAIVCNEDGDCWRVKEKYTYKPEFGVRVYADDWKWDDNDKGKYRWREPAREGPGYWRKGVWIDF